MRRNLGIPVLAALAMLALLALPVLAHDAGEGADDPRCADWAAGNAPAGLDLSAVCVAREVVGTYTDPGTGQQPLLAWTGAALVAGMGLALVGVLALRFGSRPVARRLAPQQPLAWWVCPGCRSVNADGRGTCYACGHVAPAESVPRMPTAADPGAEAPTPAGATPPAGPAGG